MVTTKKKRNRSVFRNTGLFHFSSNTVYTIVKKLYLHWWHRCYHQHLFSIMSPFHLLQDLPLSKKIKEYENIHIHMYTIFTFCITFRHIPSLDAFCTLTCSFKVNVRQANVLVYLNMGFKLCRSFKTSFIFWRTVVSIVTTATYRI